MSFLNPVNEPVLRFKSTDAGAPQINYNARVAGDVKAVIKACLVTGYGATASAGWTITNEVDHVAEFVSPSTAMSDYRLGIDDTSASSTTWYYQHQDTRVNPAKNSSAKNFSNVNKTSPANGWELLVTEQGLYFIEIVQSSAVSKTVGKVTYWGRVKSALTAAETKNIGFWVAGIGSQINRPYDFFSPADVTLKHYQINNYSSITFTSANIMMVSRLGVAGATAQTEVEMSATMYLQQDGVFVAEQPGLLIKDLNNTDKLYGVYDAVVNNRPVLYVCLSYDNGNAEFVRIAARGIEIYLDYWEY